MFLLRVNVSALPGQSLKGSRIFLFCALVGLSEGFNLSGMQF